MAKHVRSARPKTKATMSKAPMPKTLDLGYRTIEVRVVKEVDPMSDNAGLWVNEKDLVLIEAGRKGPDLVNILLHEVKHAMWTLGHISATTTDLSKDDLEEHLVTVLTNFETELFRRNPALLMWVASELADG